MSCWRRCGDVATMEALAAASILRERAPELKLRFVNVVDLFKLQPASEHPHGSTEREFDGLFTTDKPIIFNFHGYPWLIHKLAYRFKGHENLHVHGYKEKGNINTPFELAMLNETSRFHLVIDVIDRVPKLRTKAGAPEGGDEERHHRQPALRARARHGSAGDRRLDLAVLRRRCANRVAPMRDALLVLNAGSSSLKFSVFLDDDPPRPLLRGQIEGLLDAAALPGARRRAPSIAEKEWPAGSAPRPRGRDRVPVRVGRAAACSASIASSAVGHRVVHGGARFAAPVARRRRDLAELEALVPLAPLHQPHNLAAIRAVARDGAGADAGRVLRHGVSPDAAAGRAGLCPAAPLRRRGRAPLRVSRLVLRIRRLRAVTRRCRAPPPGARSSRTWATAPACAPCEAGGASPRPWASRRWTG